MSTQPKRLYSPEEYLAIERNADVRSEYFRGEMFQMVGASRAHNLITSNIARELGNQLKGGPCDLYISDMRVKVSSTGLYTYPDVTVACGDIQFEDSHVDTLLNPTVIFEVLSPSTEAYDRGKKFERYRTIASLREYVLVAQDAVRIEHYVRQPDGGWLLTDLNRPEEVLELPSISCKLPLREIYARVDFDRAERSETARPSR
jgi:Uma2 family endonuclease